MKILLYSINFPPELTGVGKYTGEMAAWLAESGHEVRVVTAPPYYPDWQVWPGYRDPQHKPYGWKGVRVWRAPLWVPAKPSGLTRLIHLASFALGSLPLMLRQLAWRPDVVWVVEPPLFCAPTALIVARLTGARAWLHVQDYEVDAAFSLGLLRGEWVRRIVTGLERWLMRRFDRVSTISEHMMNRASVKGVAAGQLVHFPNWIDLDAIQPLNAPSSYRAALGIPADAVVALYSGNMGGKQGLGMMAEAARFLSDDQDVHFVFCGNGAGRAELEQLAVGLQNVRFLDLQPAAHLNDLLGLADIHLLPQRDSAADLVMPSKLTGMLASGRAVIATTHADTELGKVIQGCGMAVAPGDAAGFAAAIRSLARDPVQRIALGQAGRRYAELCLGMGPILQRFESALHTASGRLAPLAPVSSNEIPVLQRLESVLHTASSRLASLAPASSNETPILQRIENVMHAASSRPALLESTLSNEIPVLQRFGSETHTASSRPTSLESAPSNETLV